MEKPESAGLSAKLLRQYGPTLTGSDLYSALGFKTYAAFYRCLGQGGIEVRVFNLPGRKGWFASTVEVADWLERRTHAANPAPISEGDTK